MYGFLITLWLVLTPAEVARDLPVIEYWTYESASLELCELKRAGMIAQLDVAGNQFMISDCEYNG
jgi:hypothetical protein